MYLRSVDMVTSEGIGLVTDLGAEKSVAEDGSSRPDNYVQMPVDRIVEWDPLDTPR